MDFEIRIDGKVAVKLELNPSLIQGLLRGTAIPHEVPKSSPVTPTQAEELLSRIDARSARFLKQIAVNNGGITWGEARAILGIDDPGDWAAFSAAYGKGITRALRHILGDKSARLVWWIDEDEQWASDQDSFRLYVDGPALRSLREVSGVIGD